CAQGCVIIHLKHLDKPRFEAINSQSGLAPIRADRSWFPVADKRLTVLAFGLNRIQGGLVPPSLARVSLLVLLSTLLPSAWPATMPQKASPELHRNRLEELYRRCPDGLVLLRGEADWFRKREWHQFGSTYMGPNFKQERDLYYLAGIE